MSERAMRALSYLKAQGKVRPERAREAVEEVLRCSRREAREVLHELVDEGFITFDWNMELVSR